MGTHHPKTVTKQIGVTGGIGSGKSTVCKVFAMLGAPVYEADGRAKWLMNHDTTLKNAIVDKFGEEAYQADGSLNRSWLAEQVFNDEEKVTFLNQLVHPRVAEDYVQWVQQHQDKPYVVREAAIMLEAGYAKNLDAVINVAVPEDERLMRVLLRDPQRDEKQVRGIMAKQLSEAERMEKATYNIKNYDEYLVIPQVLKLHEKFVS